MDYIALGKNVKKFRLMRSMRQKDLAELCDSSDSYIGHIENARGIPSEPMSIKWTEKRENQIKSCSAWLGDRPLLCEWGLTEL